MIAARAGRFHPLRMAALPISQSAMSPTYVFWCSIRTAWKWDPGATHDRIPPELR
jgi:hypothetical protein